MSTTQTTTEKWAALPARMTWDEFLAWDADARAEWVNGEVILMSPNSGLHQKIVTLLHLFIWTFLSRTQRGDAWTAPMLMRLPEKPSGREPDVIVLLDEHRDRYRETFIDGPADLVIEVISEESQARDRGEKYYEYEAAGIPEYWLIDPLRESADFYRLDENGHYQRIAPDADGRCRSAVLPGFYVDPAWLWRAETIDPGEAVDLVQGMV